MGLKRVEAAMDYIRSAQHLKIRLPPLQRGLWTTNFADTTRLRGLPLPFRALGHTNFAEN